MRPTASHPPRPSAIAADLRDAAEAAEVLEAHAEVFAAEGFLPG
jgi:hypothetical protein